MRFDTMCNCIDENWKALKARIQASITGIKLNGTTYYQTDGTGICDLGSIETEPPTASEVLMDDGTSVQDAIDNHTAKIDNLGDGLADSVKNVEIVEVTNGLNIQTTKNGGSIAQAGLISAGADMKMTGKTIDISDALKTTITSASETAESASTKADDAQTDATEALTKANAAITGIGTAVVDTALEMNIDKNDGSTATEPLFTAGTNLRWVDSTLHVKPSITMLVNTSCGMHMTLQELGSTVTMGYVSTTQKITKQSLPCIVIFNKATTDSATYWEYNYGAIIENGTKTLIDEWVKNNVQNLNMYENYTLRYRVMFNVSLDNQLMGITAGTDISTATISNAAYFMLEINADGSYSVLYYPNQVNIAMFWNDSTTTYKAFDINITAIMRY